MKRLRSMGAVETPTDEKTAKNSDLRLCRMTVTKAAKPHFVTIFKRVKVKTEQNFSKHFNLRYLALCDPARREHGSQK
jgi:hypothetical protein